MQGYVVLGDAPALMKVLEDVFTDEFMQANSRFESFYLHFRSNFAHIFVVQKIIIFFLYTQTFTFL